MSNLINVLIPGPVSRTTRGSVRLSTTRRLIRMAREKHPDLAEVAAVELSYPSSTYDREVPVTRVTFDLDKAKHWGF